MRVMFRSLSCNVVLCMRRTDAEIFVNPLMDTV